MNQVVLFTTLQHFTCFHSTRLQAYSGLRTKRIIRVFYIFRKIRTYANVFSFRVRVSSSHDPSLMCSPSIIFPSLSSPHPSASHQFLRPSHASSIQCWTEGRILSLVLDRRTVHRFGQVRVRYRTKLPCQCHPSILHTFKMVVNMTCGRLTCSLERDEVVHHLPTRLNQSRQRALVQTPLTVNVSPTCSPSLRHVSMAPLTASRRHLSSSSNSSSLQLLTCFQLGDSCTIRIRSDNTRLTLYRAQAMLHRII